MGGGEQEQVMQELQRVIQSDPRLAAAFQANPQAVIAQLLGGLGGMGGGGAARVPDEISPEENESIERLVQLGFDKAKATEAYFACGKDKEMAANFLFEGGGDEDMPDAMQD